MCSLATGVAAGIALWNYDKFTNANDPHNEPDFGSFEFAGEKCFWKLDYYDKSMEVKTRHEKLTTRVMTTMLASEYQVRGRMNNGRR